MNFNKFQTALNFMDWHCKVTHVEQEKLLQELVDRAEPKKTRDSFCDSCNAPLKQFKPYAFFCFRCGQAIDWSKDE